MKAFDPDSFSQRITEDFTWRVKEISDLKQVVKLSGGSYGSVARKAALALIYAHWEGYVLFVATSYLSYIAQRKRPLSSLMPSLRAVGLGNHVQEWQRQRDTIRLRLKIIETIKTMENEQFKKVPSGAVNTGGNLDYDRFSDICHVMMIDPIHVVSDQEYLDKEIVGTRNRIAHGDDIVVDDVRLSRASDFILSIMRSFRTHIENCVVSNKFVSANQ